MVGMATGLAEAGFIPFCYSIATFASLRAYEMIRNGPIAHGLPVRVRRRRWRLRLRPERREPLSDRRCRIDAHPARDGGHHSGGSPPGEGRRAFDVGSSGTGLLPAGKDDHTVVDGLDGRFELGKVDIVRTGSEVVLLAMGAAALDAVDAATRLEQTASQRRSQSSGRSTLRLWTISARFFRSTRWRSRSRRTTSMARSARCAAEVIAEAGLDCRLLRCGVEATPDGRSGSQTYLHALHGIGPEQVGDRVIAALS